MMYAGLRIAETCAITAKDRADDRLRVDKEVQELYVTGKPRSVKVGPVKTSKASIVNPHWLANRYDTAGQRVMRSVRSQWNLWAESTRHA
jgi:site-specific recombinase XerC